MTIRAKPARRRADEIVARGAEAQTERDAHHHNLRIPSPMLAQIRQSIAEDPRAQTLTAWILEACFQRLSRSQRPDA